MKATHILTITARCPKNNERDEYECIVLTERLLLVETILAEAAKFEDTKIYQEDLCQKLAETLGCVVTLIGMHSGVKSEVTCGT